MQFQTTVEQSQSTDSLFDKNEEYDKVDLEHATNSFVPLLSAQSMPDFTNKAAKEFYWKRFRQISQREHSNSLQEFEKLVEEAQKERRGHSPTERKTIESLFQTFNPFNVSNKSGTRRYQPSEVTMVKAGKNKSRGGTSSIMGGFANISFNNEAMFEQ